MYIYLLDLSIFILLPNYLLELNIDIQKVNYKLNVQLNEIYVLLWVFTSKNEVRTKIFLYKSFHFYMTTVKEFRLIKIIASKSCIYILYSSFSFGFLSFFIYKLDSYSCSIQTFYAKIFA